MRLFDWFNMECLIGIRFLLRWNAFGIRSYGLPFGLRRSASGASSLSRSPRMPAGRQADLTRQQYLTRQRQCVKPGTVLAWGCAPNPATTNEWTVKPPTRTRGFNQREQTSNREQRARTSK